jgi:DNA-binding transcriptional ArsR family regulator
MSESAFAARSRPESDPRRGGEPDADEPAADPEELLALLSDDYARSMLEALVGESLPAREIAERLDVSRATVYRRLDRLEEAGLVEGSMTYDADGHHRRQFTTAVDRLTFTVEDGGVDVADAS